MVKLLSYNIEYCRGYKGRLWEYLKFWKIFTAPKEISKEIACALKKVKPDILAFTEISIGHVPDQQLSYFKKKLGMHYFIGRVKYPFHGFWKILHHLPIVNKQGNALLSKKKLTDVHYKYFNLGTKRVVLQATVHCPKKVTLLLVHLALGPRARSKQIKELAGFVKKIKGPVMVLGDFNTLGGEKELKQFLKKTGLKLTFKGSKKTQPSYDPSRRLDYVLTSRKIKIKKHKIFHWKYSDHLPLYVEFKVT